MKNLVTLAILCLFVGQVFAQKVIEKEINSSADRVL